MTYEAWIALISFVVLLRLIYPRRRPNPPTIELTPIPFDWVGDDESSDSGNVSGQAKDHTVSVSSERRDEDWEEFLSVPRTQHFLSATDLRKEPT